MPDPSILDLFTPIVPENKWHPNFARIKSGASIPEIDVLNRWAHGFRDRDGKFVKEFQTTFNSSFWELYLHALFCEAHCKLEQSHSRPDFVIIGGPLGQFTAEAVIASNPKQHLPEWAWDPTQPPLPREDMLDLACLRLSQAIVGKHNKWTTGYSSLPHCSGHPFVVCVCPFDQPWASLQGTEAIDRVLFKGPRPVVSATSGEPRVLGRTVSSHVFKPSGASVELGIFTTPKYSAISAVIFSSLATWSKVHALSDPAGRLMLFNGARLFGDGLKLFVEKGGDYVENIEDGAHIFLNPFAKLPLDPDPFFELGLGVHLFAHDGTLTRIPRRGLLIGRNATEIRDPSEPTKPHSPPAGATPHVPALPPDGTPFAGPSSSPFATEVTLELHRGWTLYVGRDPIDKDWCVLGKRLICRSLNVFVNAEMEPDDELMTSFLPTRDAAVAAARHQIAAMEASRDTLP